MWACSGTTSYWKGSWAVINWKCPPFFRKQFCCEHPWHTQGWFNSIDHLIIYSNKTSTEKKSGAKGGSTLEPFWKTLSLWRLQPSFPYIRAQNLGENSSTFDGGDKIMPWVELSYLPWIGSSELWLQFKKNVTLWPTWIYKARLSFRVK